MDAGQCAEIHFAARQAMTYLPKVHTTTEVHDWTRKIVFVEQMVWVAEIGDQVVGYASLANGILTNLYVHPSHQRHSASGGGEAGVSRGI